MKRRGLAALALTATLTTGAALVAPALPAAAAGTATLGAFGTTYTQDFSTLAATGTSSVVPEGWDFAEVGTSGNANGLYAAGTGSSNAGDTYSFGPAASTDRALGGLQSGTLNPTIGLSLTNGGVGTITSLAVSYSGEQWRLGALARPDRMDFQYSLDATSPITGTWTDVDLLDFVGPATGPVVGALDGNVNRTVLSGTIAGLSLSPGATVWLRWASFDATGADDGLAVDDVAITPAGIFVGEDAPAVAGTVPADGATGVAVNQNVTVTFTEPVTVSGDWFALTCATSGAHPATVSGGPTTFVLDPTTDFAFGESCTLTIAAGLVSDVDGNDPPDSMVVDFTAGFTAQADPCAAPFTPAYAIQGSGAAAAITGTVTTRGVVVGDYELPAGAATASSLRGFYLQDATGDGDPATSDAIFVFNGNNNSVALGDVVQVTGTASEFQGQTQVSATSLRTCGTGATVPAADVTFPVASATALESVEGMLVRLPQTMTVTEHFQLGRFGQVVLSQGGRLAQPTNVVAPGAPALALQAQNDLRKIILDDASQAQNPDPIVFGRNGQPLSATNTVRGGDTATGIVGVMTFTWAGNAASGNAFRVRPVNALGGSVEIVGTNPRPTAAPAVGGTVKVAGMNLLNYFNTFDGLPDPVGNDNCRNGTTGAAADCRGADTAAEFARQTPKTVAAILKLNPDVLGVNEIENDGYGPDSALAHLVDALNAATAPGTYAFVDADANTGQVDAMGGDAIKVAMIYKPSVVSLTGATAALNSVAFVNGGDGAPRARASLAQAFQVNDTGAVFVVNVNHFKSKGSACDAPDAGDGQGNCNLVRTNAARALVDWLATDPTGTGDPDVLLVGDYNSYAKEDPITLIQGAGYTNLIEAYQGPDAYSYVFDGQWGYLDHAFGSASIVGQIADVVDYHINADEPSVLDYNTDFKTPGLVASLYAPDEFRVSDHDPVLIGLTPNAAPTVTAGPYTVGEGGTLVLTADGRDPNGDTLAYEWDLDDDGTYETAGASPTFSAVALDGPTSATVGVRVTDGGGLSATATATVAVTNVAPSVTATFVRSRVECGLRNGLLTVTTADPAAADTRTVVIAWGDGTTETVAAVTGPLSRSHTYTRAGTYTAMVTVTDDDGGSTTTTATVSVNYLTTGVVLPGLGFLPIKYGRTITAATAYLDCNLSVPATLAPTFQVTSSTGAVVLSGSLRFERGVYVTQIDTRLLPDPSGRYRIVVTVPATGQTSSASFSLRP